MRRTPAWVALLLGLLALLGVGAVILRALNPGTTRGDWGYLAAALAFILSSAQAAPILAWATRTTQGQWGRPLRGPADAWSAAGIASFLILLVLLPLVPAPDGRQSIWGTWRLAAPWLWDASALLLFVGTGLAILYLGALPDVAWLRDRRQSCLAGLRSRLFARWEGSLTRWSVLEGGLNVLGGFYLMLYVLAHTLVSLDLSMSMLQGWRSAVYPPFHAVTGLQGGVATLLLTALFVRWWRSDEGGIQREHVRMLATLLLVLTLFRFYFWWSDFIVKWYGRTPEDQATMGMLTTGPAFWPFMVAITLALFVPFFILLWNPVRRSIWGPAIAATSVLVGLFLDRVRLYVIPWAAEHVTGHSLTEIPALPAPDALDVLMVVGGLSLALLCVWGAAVLVSPLAPGWERLAGQRLRREVTVARAPALAVGKPR